MRALRACAALRDSVALKCPRALLAELTRRHRAAMIQQLRSTALRTIQLTHTPEGIALSESHVRRDFGERSYCDHLPSNFRNRFVRLLTYFFLRTHLKLTMTGCCVVRGARPHAHERACTGSGFRREKEEEDATATLDLDHLAGNGRRWAGCASDSFAQEVTVRRASGRLSLRSGQSIRRSLESSTSSAPCAYWSTSPQRATWSARKNSVAVLYW